MKYIDFSLGTESCTSKLWPKVNWRNWNELRNIIPSKMQPKIFLQNLKFTFSNNWLVLHDLGLGK